MDFLLGCPEGYHYSLARLLYLCDMHIRGKGTLEVKLAVALEAKEIRF